MPTSQSACQYSTALSNVPAFLIWWFEFLSIFPLKLRRGHWFQPGLLKVPSTTRRPGRNDCALWVGSSLISVAKTLKKPMAVLWWSFPFPPLFSSSPYKPSPCPSAATRGSLWRACWPSCVRWATDTTRSCCRPSAARTTWGWAALPTTLVWCRCRLTRLNMRIQQRLASKIIK